MTRKFSLLLTVKLPHLMQITELSWTESLLWNHQHNFLQNSRRNRSAEVRSNPVWPSHANRDSTKTHLSTFKLKTVYLLVQFFEVESVPLRVKSKEAMESKQTQWNNKLSVLQLCIFTLLGPVARIQLSKPQKRRLRSCRACKKIKCWTVGTEWV